MRWINISNRANIICVEPYSKPGYAYDRTIQPTKMTCLN